MKDEYYDGPVIDTDRTIEEIEKDIQKEKERCKKMRNWEETEMSLLY